MFRLYIGKRCRLSPRPTTQNVNEHHKLLIIEHFLANLRISYHCISTAGDNTARWPLKIDGVNYSGIQRCLLLRHNGQSR